MAGLYILLDAEFIVGVQVIVYVGGITVLYLFVISLIVLEAHPAGKHPEPAVAGGGHRRPAVMVEVAFFLRATCSSRCSRRRK